MAVDNKAKINFNNLKKTIQIPIDKNFICLRSLNPNRSRFEVEYSLEKGKYVQRNVESDCKITTSTVRKLTKMAKRH